MFRACVLAVVLTLSGATGAQEMPSIASGQEDLLARMLGRGASLPGSCAWAGARVEETRVVSWYDCAGARVYLELRHPTQNTRAVARTEKFSIRVQGGTPPPGLIDAISGHIRAGESAFRWSGGSALFTPDNRRAARGLGSMLVGAFVAAIAAAFLAVRLARRAARRKCDGKAGTFVSLRDAVFVSVLGAGAAAAVRQSCRAFGDAALGAIEHGERVPVATHGALMVAFLVLAIAAVSVASQLRPRGSPWIWFVLGGAAYVGIAYPRSFRHATWTLFGDIAAGRPNVLYRENRPNRPPVLYRQDAYGFRGAGFRLEKSQPRVIVVGDSYVFGIGVEENDSLPVALRDELLRRDPTRRIEVLNLGVPGDNLASHVDVVAAAAQLSPDVIVLGLTLPNDLSRWDVQSPRRDAARISAFSFGRFLFGDAASPFWDIARLERSVTSAGLAHLDAQLARLETIRRTMHPSPAIVVFAFTPMPASVRARVQRFRAMQIVPEFEFMPEDYLPIDGHPSATGTHRFAERIADVVAPALAAVPR